MEGVVTPGGHLLIMDDLLTLCAGILRTIVFTLFILMTNSPAGYAIFRWLLVGRDGIGRKRR